MCEQVQHLSSSGVSEVTLHIQEKKDDRVFRLPSVLCTYTRAEKVALKQRIEEVIAEKGYTYPDLARALELTPKYAREMVRAMKFSGEKGQQLLTFLDISVDSLKQEEVTVPVTQKVTEEPVLEQVETLDSLLAQEVGEVTSLVRFLLTSADFPTLRGKVTQKEIEDTKKLILEVARRVKLFCTLEDEQMRKTIYFALEDAINTLFVNLHSAGTAYPWKAAKELESRAEFAKKII